MEVEGTEQNIILQPEGMIVGAVTSVNGQTGDVVLTTSDLENTSDYQTGQDVQDAIAGKQDKLTAGNNIQISEQNVISATNTTYSAGNGVNISGENSISVDTTVVATQQNLSDEVTNRENADIYLQGQIDAISASSDVVDIVGTYAELQNYDTQHLKDNDIIKVLQDETHGNATTYYRWSTSTQTFTLIGQEGPYYTKAGADAQFVPQTRTVNSKALSANIMLTASDVGALGSSDVVQTTGTSTSQVMSQNAVTNELNNKLNVADYVVDTQLADSDNPVQNRVLNGLLGDMPSDFFSGSATTTPTASTEVQFGNILGLDDAQLLGDTYQQTYSGKNLFNVDGDFSYGGNYADQTTKNGDGTITVSANFSVSRNAGQKLNLLANTDYILSCTMTATTSTQAHKGIIEIMKGIRGVNLSNVATNYVDAVGATSFTFTTPADVSEIWVEFSSNGDATSTFANIQIEQGSTATSYEPYTGGIASPNPSYPQDVQVVTGEQTVTIGDGVSSQNYTIDLGSTELCKLGDYQDYIYKSGDDWYVHKATGKIILNGSESWGLWNAGSSQPRRLGLRNLSMWFKDSMMLASNYFVRVPYSGMQTDLSIWTQTEYLVITDKNSYWGSATDFQTWLSTHNLIVYYELKTPTDTKITDATLISELEELLNASTYDGGTNFVITATGTNLPAPLQLTAVNANAKGIIYKLRA